MTQTYLDRVLLRLRRQYSKDEYVGLLLEKIKTLEFKNGELLSENEELKFNARKQYSPVKEWSKDDYILVLKQTIKNKVKAKGIAEKQAKEWRDKYFNLKALVK